MSVKRVFPKRSLDLDPHFPETGYCVVLFVMINGHLSIIPLGRLFQSLDDISLEVQQLVIMEKERNPETIILDACVLLHLKCDRLLPLKKEYWDQPELEMQILDRIHVYMMLLKQAKLHQILVTTPYYNKKLDQWDYAITMPFKLHTSDDVIERFLRSSKDPVDIRSKYSALYSVTKTESYNWEEQTIHPVNFDFSEDIVH